MKATELFPNEGDWAKNNPEEVEELNSAFRQEGIEILDEMSDALRMLEIEDVDLSEDVITAMESGEVVIWAPDARERIESRMLRKENDYSVRIALIDNTKKSAALGVAQAMLLDADIIVAGPYKIGSEDEMSEHLVQAAQGGHSVIALGDS